ncbi:MAG: hypothetical protein K2N94_06270 [Lachnospiraceae bacterium]|nr:hypothetical protein [Lachnospiraceae bacterium]
MVQEWLENGIFLYVMAGICGVGIALRLLMSLHFGRLLRRTASMGDVYGGWALRVRKEYEECVRANGRLNSVDIFVDKCVGAKRMAGIMLSTWDRFCGQTLLLNAGVLVVAGVSGIFYQVDKESVLFTFFIGIWLLIANMVVDNLVNFEEKAEQVKRNLKDYFENRIDSSEEGLYAVEAQEEAETAKEELTAEKLQEEAGAELSAADGTQAERLARAVRAMKDAKKQQDAPERKESDESGPAASGQSGRGMTGSTPELNNVSGQERPSGQERTPERTNAPRREAAAERKGAAKQGNMADRTTLSEQEGTRGAEEPGASAKLSKMFEAAKKPESGKDKLVSFSEKAGKGAGAPATVTGPERPAETVTLAEEEGKNAGKTAGRPRESRRAAAAQKKREQMKRQLLMEMEREELPETGAQENTAENTGYAKQENAAGRAENREYAKQENAAGRTENREFAKRENAAEQAGGQAYGRQAGSAPQEQRRLWQESQWQEAQEQTAAASEKDGDRQMSIEEAAAFLAAEFGGDEKNSKLIEDVLKEFLF